jgi:ABC-2 type transport system permease protein
MRKLFDRLNNYRLRALIKKEYAQTRHDRKLMLSLTVLPVVQLTLVGFALSAAVSNVRLTIVDDSRSPESRELIATLTESKSFRLAGYYSSVDQLGDAVSQGNADAGMVVPYDYAWALLRDRQTTIQFLLNATNANTATISRGYAVSMMQRFNTGLVHGVPLQLALPEPRQHRQAQPRPKSRWKNHTLTVRECRLRSVGAEHRPGSLSDQTTYPQEAIRRGAVSRNSRRVSSNLKCSAIL